MYYRYYYNTSSSPPAIPLRDIPATGVRRPCSIPRFARQRHGTHVLLQGRQIAFERPCRYPRTSRRELSGEVFNCHLKPSNRSSDSLNDLLNSSSESIASSSDFIEDSALLKAARVVELVSEGSDGFQLLNVLLKPSRQPADAPAAPAPDSLVDSLAAQLEIERSRNAELMEALAAERDRAARAEAEAKAQLAEANARVAELAGKLASLAERQQAIAATPWWRRGRMAMKLLGPGGE